jgi:hypothetical protein
MSSRERDLQQQLRQLLGSRPGWSLESSSTPGAPPAWCFAPHVHTRLVVAVDAGQVDVYLEDLDADLRLDDIVAFSTWLVDNEALFAGSHPPGAEELDATLRRKLEEWRGPVG